MSYFPVDDQMTFHPKFIAAGNAATGVWVRAGAWVKNHVTGGFVPKDIADVLGKAETKRLVAVGLWVADAHPTLGSGFRFHDWEDQAGNGTEDEERSRRESKRIADRERQRRRRESQASHGVTSPRISPPSVPVPSPALDDATAYPESALELNADESRTDPSPFVIQSAKNLGIQNLEATRRRLEQAAEEPVTSHAAVVLTDYILSHSKDPVKDVDAYVATACRNTPEEVKWYAETLDIGVLAQ